MQAILRLGIKVPLLLGTLAIFSIFLLPATSWAAAGTYFLTGESETLGVIELKPDGTFRFAIMVGNAEERDEGSWIPDGESILLRSATPDKPPTYRFVSSQQEDTPGIRVRIEGVDTNVLDQSFWVRIDANAQPFSTPRLSNDFYQSRLIPPVKRIQLTFTGALRRYPVFTYTPINEGHNSYVFSVDAGNFGHTRLDGVRLVRIGSALVMPISRGANRDELRFELQPQ